MLPQKEAKVEGIFVAAAVGAEVIMVAAAVENEAIMGRVIQSHPTQGSRPVNKSSRPSSKWPWKSIQRDLGRRKCKGQGLVYPQRICYLRAPDERELAEQQTGFSFDTETFLRSYITITPYIYAYI
jgi:hypothetical protein